MKQLPLLAVAFAGLAGLLLAEIGLGQAANGEPARLVVKVPADAQVFIQGDPTKATGEVRHFVSPPLPSGWRYHYTVKAVWTAGDQPVSREKRVEVVPGKTAEVDLREAVAQADPKKKPEPIPVEPREKDKPKEVGKLKPEAIPVAPRETEKPKGAAEKPKEPEREPDVIFVPTAQAVVDEMLKMAKVTKNDIVYDLGCGDGRIPVTAAKTYGCKAFGFDVDPNRIKDSTENVKKNKVEKLVTITKQDIFTLDLRPATVITLYLLPELNVKLVPQLEKMKPGTRIVSHDFNMEGYKPVEMKTMRAKNDSGFEREHTIYMWTIPLQKEKD